MKTQSPDTSIKAEKVLISVLRAKSRADKFSMVLSLSQMAIQLSRRAILRANKNIGEDQIKIKFIEIH